MVVVITMTIETLSIILNQAMAVLITATILLTISITVPIVHLPMVVAILLALLVVTLQCILLAFIPLELLLMVFTVVVVMLLHQLVVVTAFDNLVVAYALTQLNANWASFKITSMLPYPLKPTPQFKPLLTQLTKTTTTVMTSPTVINPNTSAVLITLLTMAFVNMKTTTMLMNLQPTHPKIPLQTTILLMMTVATKTTRVTEFRQPLQVKIHLEMPGILVQLGHIQCA